MFKSIVPSFIGFIFGFHTAFSGQKAWEDIYQGLYGVLGTSLAVTLWFTLDQFIPISKAPQIESYIPKIYAYQRQHELMSLKDFYLWLLYGIYASLIIYYIPMFGMNAFNSQGKEIDLF